jgi:hypothetical protein
MHPDSRKRGCATRLLWGTALLRGSLFEGAVREYDRGPTEIREIDPSRAAFAWAMGYTKHIELRLPHNGPFEPAVWQTGTPTAGLM